MFPSSNEVLEFPVTETRPLLFLCDPGQHVLPGRDKRVGSHERALYCVYSKSIHSEAQGKPLGEGIPGVYQGSFSMGLSWPGSAQAVESWLARL